MGVLGVIGTCALAVRIRVDVHTIAGMGSCTQQCRYAGQGHHPPYRPIQLTVSGLTSIRRMAITHANPVANWIKRG